MLIVQDSMQKRLSWLVISLVSCLNLQETLAKENTQNSNSPILAKVNQQIIDQQTLDDAINMVQLSPSTNSQHTQPLIDLREQVLNELIVTEALYQAAKKEKLEHKPEVNRVLLATKKKILAEAWLAENLSQHPISDEEIKAEYDRQAKIIQIGRNANEYKIKHIVVATEAQAKQLIKLLKQGKPFDLLAHDHSLDQHSGLKGGHLGWNMPDQLIAPLGDVILTLPKGQIYPYPIHSAIGWHIVQLDDLREVNLPNFNLVKPVILKNMVEARKNQLIEELMQQTKVEIINPTINTSTNSPIPLTQ